MTHSPAPTSSTGQRFRIVIVGGGLAGMAAAVRLSQAGVPVTLVETRGKLGGRATSFIDPTTGLELDNSTHVLLGCCTYLQDFYRRLGVADSIQWNRELFFAWRKTNGDVGRSVLAGDDLPAPLHLAGAFLRFDALSWSDRLAVAQGMLAILRLSDAQRVELHQITFAQWLAEHGQPKSAIDRFWSLIAVSAVNETVDRMAADHAIQVFRQGMLESNDAYRMGVSRVPLVRLYGKVRSIIEQTGGDVLLSTSAEQLVMDPSGRRIACLALADGRRLAGDLFVSTVPFDRLAKLLPDRVKGNDRRLAGLDRFSVSPILGIHMLWQPTASASSDRLLEQSHLFLLDSPLHVVFDKGPVALPSGQRAFLLSGIVSAAHEMVDWPADRIAQMARQQIQAFLPEARRWQMVHHRIVKEKRATFSAIPGLAAHRPLVMAGEQERSIGNLLIAGDWSATGWPATMEGAVRSGYRAAEAVMPQGQGNMPMDLPASELMDWWS